MDGDSGGWLQALIMGLLESTGQPVPTDEWERAENAALCVIHPLWFGFSINQQVLEQMASL